MENYTKDELVEALRAIESTVRKCEKVLPKLQQGSSQHTLLVRRIKALMIAQNSSNENWTLMDAGTDSLFCFGRIDSPHFINRQQPRFGKGCTSFASWCSLTA